MACCCGRQRTTTADSVGKGSRGRDLSVDVRLSLASVERKRWWYWVVLLWPVTHLNNKTLSAYIDHTSVS